MNSTSVISVISFSRCPVPQSVILAKGDLCATFRDSRESGNPEMPMIGTVVSCEDFWIPGRSLPRTGYGARKDGLGVGRTHEV